MTRYSIEPRTRRYVKGHEFLSFETIIGCRTRFFKNSIQKSKACEFLRNKIAYAVTKSNDDKIVGTDENPRNIEEITILPEKGDEILNKLREVFKNGTL